MENLIGLFMRWELAVGMQSLDVSGRDMVFSFLRMIVAVCGLAGHTGGGCECALGWWFLVFFVGSSSKPIRRHFFVSMTWLGWWSLTRRIGSRALFIWAVNACTACSGCNMQGLRDDLWAIFMIMWKIVCL